MKSQHVRKIPTFSGHAKTLRKHFDAQFANPERAHEGRFCWDFWNLPDRYTHLRTPAATYFPEAMYLAWHEELVLWGRRQLGCWDISPVWLSCYVDGCEQRLHTDVPHGPWAFVFSLSPQKSIFRGGETIIAEPQMLSYWQNFRTTGGQREEPAFFRRHKSKFNELILFDPRFPHGVTPVSGTMDPRQGRLVLHGWFTAPKTYIEGPMDHKKCESVLNDAYGHVAKLVLDSPPAVGTLSVQLKIGGSGRVQNFNWGTCHLVDASGQKPNQLLQGVREAYTNLKFPSAKGLTRITVPLIID